MYFYQYKILLKARTPGMHLITREVTSSLKDLNKLSQGIANIFVQHTSCAVTINENADPDVRHDLDIHLKQMVPENQSYYYHTLEGSDDMPAHIKASLIGQNLTIPITNGALNLGIWQGIYLCEFRNHGGPRTLVATIMGQE